MLNTLKKYFSRKQPETEIPEVVEQAKREGEVTSNEYFSSLLSSTDAENVQYLRDSLHSALLENNVGSALIAVGSVVTGVSSKEQYFNSAGPDDIDLKVIIASQAQGNTFYGVLEKWSKNLNGRFTEIDGHPNEIRFTHRQVPEEHIDFHYDGGFRIKPSEGKTIDLIVKGVGYLPAGPHIEAERERNHAFVVLYHDK
jgi:hypothetical protein